MLLEYVPLLQAQRDLQGMPRDLNRFKQYLRTMLDGSDSIEFPPLAAMNPMGKEHVTRLLDDLLALDADGIAARAAAEASALLGEVPGCFKIALVVVDDLMGGWTNRCDYEFKFRFEAPVGDRLPRWLKEYWLTGVLWASERASPRAVREAILLPAHRVAYVRRNDPARTLGDMLAQEGHVMTAAGCEAPTLEEEDLAYTRDVLTPFLDKGDRRTCMEFLFGDEPCSSLGFTPRGLSPWAGLALALYDARLSDHGTAVVGEPAT